jgi:hypothetical protein
MVYIIFLYLNFQIEEDICQQRIVCDIFTDAEKYKPISDIFMRKLTYGKIRWCFTIAYFLFFDLFLGLIVAQ